MYATSLTSGAGSASTPFPHATTSRSAALLMQSAKAGMDAAGGRSPSLRGASVCPQTLPSWSSRDRWCRSSRACRQ
eukprot:2448231-Pleurochrysis_carterae.AAC.1